MKLTKIGLITLGFLSLTHADMFIHTQAKEAQFSPKVEIHNNLTTIIPQNNTVVEERREGSHGKAKNVTNYLLPKLNNGKITINNDTTIHVCGEKTYLIAIGLNKYKYIGMKLQQAVNDAKNMAKKITSSCKNTETHLLLDKDATKENILKTLKAINNKAGKKDSVIFFYSGNGFNYNHQNYIVAYDSAMKKDMPKIDSFVSTKKVSSLFKLEKIKKGLMIFDACTRVLNPYK